MPPFCCFIEQSFNSQIGVFIAKNDHGRGSFVRKQLTGFVGGLGGPRRISTGLWKGLGFGRGRGLKGTGLWKGAGCGGFGRGFQRKVLIIRLWDCAGLAGFSGHARGLKSWPGKGADDPGNNSKGVQNNDKGVQKLLAAHGAGKASGVVDARFACWVTDEPVHTI